MLFYFVEKSKSLCVLSRLGWYTGGHAQMLFYTKGYFIIFYFFAFTCAISGENINVSDNNLDQLQKLSHFVKCNILRVFYGPIVRKIYQFTIEDFFFKFGTFYIFFQFKYIFFGTLSDHFFENLAWQHWLRYFHFLGEGPMVYSGWILPSSTPELGGVWEGGGGYPTLWFALWSSNKQNVSSASTCKYSELWGAYVPEI